MAQYTYAISTDFPGGTVNTSKLKDEIKASSIATDLSRIDTAGDVIDIWFDAALSAGDKTTLDGDTTGPAGGLIAAHDNTVSGDPQPSVLGERYALLGTLGGFTQKGALDVNQVFYGRSWLNAGTYSKMETLLVEGASGGRTIDMGVYADNGMVPEEPSGALLASTGAQDTAGSNEILFTKALGSDLVIAEAGYYWLAMVCNNSSLKYAVTRKMYKPWYNKVFVIASSYGGATLGALPGSFDVITGSAVPYIALVVK